MNLIDRVVELSSVPRSGRYTELRTVEREAILTLPAPLDDVSVRVADFLS